MAYAPELDHHSPDRLALVADLRGAIEGHQLVVYYQPKINVASRRFVGVEALVRSAHPTRGLIPPDEFIPLAEQTDLMGDLTDVVVDQALSAVARWRASGLALSVAVNLSVRSLYDPKLTTRLVGALERYRLPASLLEVEITESTVMDRPAKAREALGQITALSAYRSPSTTTAPDTPRSPISANFPWARSRSTRRSCSMWRRTGATRRSSTRRSDSRDSLGLSVVAEGWRPKGRCECSSSSAAISLRGTTSRDRCRPTWSRHGRPNTALSAPRPDESQERKGAVDMGRDVRHHG